MRSARAIQPEWTERAFDAANVVRDLMLAIRAFEDVDVDLASDHFTWSVAIPVLLGPGVPVADDAPEQTAVALVLDPEDEGGSVILPGDAMRIVGGTNGHMIWPPSTRIMEVETGNLAGQRVQFILEPDPRPAGEDAVLAGLALLRRDEPAFNDPVRLDRLRRVVGLRLSNRS